MATALRINASTGETEVVALPPVPLAEAKANKWQSAKAMRDQKIAAGCPVPGIGTFDTDDISRSNINGAVTMALIAQAAGQPFSISWKLADNSVATLDAAQMIAAGVAVGTRTAACHANAQALGIAIEAAANSAALDAIDINAGWPE